MKCSRCGGSGYETYEEDGRRVHDACYHCATTGEVDEETDFSDRLVAVANTLAYAEESDYRKAADADPYGDGYGLCAAENGLSEHDYFRTRVWDLADAIGKKLYELPLADKELLVAWNELPWEPAPAKANPVDVAAVTERAPVVPPVESEAPAAWDWTKDEIPF